jgi:hypothetical protein
MTSARFERARANPLAPEASTLTARPTGLVISRCRLFYEHVVIVEFRIKTQSATSRQRACWDFLRPRGFESHSGQVLLLLLIEVDRGLIQLSNAPRPMSRVGLVVEMEALKVDRSIRDST